MQRTADAAVAVLKSLASRNRLLLLCHLLDGERPVGELVQALALAQSVVPQQLSVLRREGVAVSRRDAQSIRYSIPDARVRKLMTTMFALFCTD
jgi:DNA-binding transcriptional ArsR family regulator